MDNLIFLKLGGSLITDKHKPQMPNTDILQQAGAEIKSALNENKRIKLVIGHGSGSYGHVPAKKFNTREGVFDLHDWVGFQEVWYQARALNQIVVKSLAASGIPIISFPPSASAVSTDRKLVTWHTDPIIHALEAGLVPLINGDVILDKVIGGTIYSTEELFFHLSHIIQPEKILVAGIEPGVWEDFPACTSVSQVITSDTFRSTKNTITGSDAIDVTGGMREKVRLILDIIQQFPASQSAIFSGLEPGNIKNALLGCKIGTQLRRQ